MAKFFNKKVYIVPGNAHKFRTEHDAVFYCNQHGIDPATIEKYDSTKEYDRWFSFWISWKWFNRSISSNGRTSSSSKLNQFWS